MKVFSLCRPPTPWRKSLRSAISNECVELLFSADSVCIRDSKNQDVGPLSFDRPAWEDFLYGLRQGEFDVVTRR